MLPHYIQFPNLNVIICVSGSQEAVSVTRVLCWYLKNLRNQFQRIDYERLCSLAESETKVPLWSEESIPGTASGIE
jgi:hypothetical protein